MTYKKAIPVNSRLKSAVAIASYLHRPTYEIQNAKSANI